MATDIYYWISDLGNYLRYGLEKVVLPKLGQGVDYSDKKY